ncbi:MAG TPA: hypothetical protein VHS79_09845 [Actinomycetes bacterium]|nr:hypothetical protein [Actinomycetes bacterium]
MTSRVSRPLLAAGVLVAALLALRGAASLVSVAPPRSATPATGSSRPTVAVATTRPVVLAEATGASLLLGGEDGLFRVDLDTRTVRPVRLPDGAPGSDGGLVRGDGTVVAVRGGTAYAAPVRPGRPATRLGPAAFALASAAPRRVWLVEQTGDPDRWFAVREVALGGPDGQAPVVARGTLALGRRPVAGVPGGLLVDVLGRGGGLAVWSPRTGLASVRLRSTSPVAVVATSGRRVAWVEGETLHLGDLASGRARVVPPPAGSGGFTAAGAFSPDGRMLAAVTQVGFSTRPALALVRVDRGEAVRVAGSDGALADRCSPCLAWAPAGDWVFFNRLGPGFGIGAYRLNHPTAARVPLDVPGSFPPSLQTI